MCCGAAKVRPPRADQLLPSYSRLRGAMRYGVDNLKVHGRSIGPCLGHRFHYLIWPEGGPDAIGLFQHVSERWRFADANLSSFPSC